MKNIFFLIIAFVISDHVKAQCIENYKIDFNKEDVIAIGESTHGNKKDWEFRKQFILQNYNDSAKLNVYIEMPSSVWSNYKLFLQNKLDTIVFYKSLQLFGLRTVDFLDFLKFVNSKPNIDVIGIDMQDYRSTVIHLYNEKVIGEKMVLPILTKIFDTIIGMGPVSVDEIERLVEELQVQNFTKEIIELDYLKQYIKYKKTLFNTEYEMDVYRDSCMAINFMKHDVNSIAQKLLFAANYHVLSDGNSMGNYLKNAYKKNYVVIITQYFEGEILAVDVQNDKWNTKNKYIMAPKKTMPNLLFKKDINNCLLNVNMVFKNCKKIMVQDIGAGSNLNTKYSGYHYADLRNINYIYFSKKTEATTYLQK